MINIANMERSILSTLILDSSLLSNYDLKHSDFNYKEHQLVYQYMQELFRDGLPIDETFLSKKGANQEVLVSILATTPIANPKAYISELKEQNRKNSILSKLNSLASKENLSSTELNMEIEKAFIDNSTEDYSILNMISIDSIEAQKPTFFLEDTLPIQQKEINLFSAKGGTGKSWILLYLLAMLEKKHNLKCFGWFSEDSIESTKDRLLTLSKLHSDFKDSKFTITNTMPKSFVEYDKNKNIKESDFFYRIKKQLQDYDVICLDPLIAFYGANENDNSEARFFMNLLNDWCKKENKTILMIHHHNKSEDNSVRGASAFIDAVRMHSVVSKVDNDDSIREISLEKTNHFFGENKFTIQLFQKYTTTIINKEITNEQKSSKRSKC
jgi:replicative DNA helicase